MKNKEKYYEDILKITIENGYWAVDKNTNKPRICRGSICDDCLFKSNCNSESINQWLEAEYQEPIHLTDDEKVILKNVDKNYRWIARDRSEELFAYADKPCKNDEKNYWNCCKHVSLCVFSHLFQFIKWSDEEPYNIDELLKQNGAER